MWLTYLPRLRRRSPGRLQHPIPPPYLQWAAELREEKPRNVQLLWGRPRASCTEAPGLMCPRKNVRGVIRRLRSPLFDRDLGIPFWQLLFFSPPSPRQPFTFLFFLTSSRYESKYCHRIWRLHKQARIARGRLVFFCFLKLCCSREGTVVIAKWAGTSAAAAEDAREGKTRDF